MQSPVRPSPIESLPRGWRRVMLHTEEVNGPRGLGRALEVNDRLADPVKEGSVKPGNDWEVRAIDRFWGWVDLRPLGQDVEGSD